MPPTSPTGTRAHPTDDELQAFAAGLSKARPRAAIAQHLTNCDPCVQRLGRLLKSTGSDPLLSRLRESRRPRSISDATPIVGPPPIVLSMGLSGSHQIVAGKLSYELLPGRRQTENGVVQSAREYPGNAVVTVTFPTPDPTRSPGGRERVVQILRQLYAVDHPNLSMPRAIELFGESWGIISDAEDAVNFHALACADSRPRGRPLYDAFRQAADGLATAHAKGVVHGDLRLPDLLLFPDGRVRVTGFLTPRLRHDAPSADPTLDIVALGHCLIAVITGQPHAIGSLAPATPSLDLLTTEERQVVDAMISPKLAGGFASMAEVARALTNLARPPQPPRNFWQRLLGR